MDDAIMEIIDFAAWATGYASRGWFIFPCHSVVTGGLCSCGKPDCGSIGKHPRTKNGLSDATQDADTVAHWWRKYPNSNIGICMGRATGLVAIDIDPKNNGADGLRSLESKYGKLPPTMKAMTGSGGFHFFYRYPANCTIKNKQKLGGVSGVDVRGEGGYVIAAPSNHASGRNYEWVGTDDLSELSGEWLALLAADNHSPIIEDGEKEYTIDPEIISRAARYLDSVPPAVSGDGGHGQTYFAACAVVHGFGIDPNAAVALLMERYNPKCKPPWSEKEIRHKVNDAARKPHVKPFGHLRSGNSDLELHSIDHATGALVSAPTAPAPTAPAVGIAPPKTPSGKMPRISNFTTDAAGGPEDEPVNYAKHISEISTEVKRVCDGQPFSVQHQLVTLRPYDQTKIPDGDVLRFINDHDELFAWLHERCEVNWPASIRKNMVSSSSREATTPVGRSVFFKHFREGTEPNYRTIEILPHTPPVPKTLYIPMQLGNATGEALKEFMDHVNAETPEDKALVLAALLTPAWGGPPGTRPAFIFCADARGSGKTKTAELICSVHGGRLTMYDKEDWDKFRSRLLADESLSARTILLDNVKHRLSGQQLESLITTENIDGHKMYVGQYSRPNRFTYFITSNMPSGSTDVSERAVIVRIGKPRGGGDWEEWSRNFLETRRGDLLADIHAVLAGPSQSAVSSANEDRWGAWQRAVLSKLPNADRLAALTKERRATIDADAEDAEDIADAIRTALTKANLQPAGRAVMFHVEHLKNIMLNSGVCDKTMTGRGVTTWLKARAGTGALTGLRYHRAAGGKRCWMWVDDNCNAASGVIEYVPVSYTGNGN